MVVGSIPTGGLCRPCSTHRRLWPLAPQNARLAWPARAPAGWWWPQAGNPLGRQPSCSPAPKVPCRGTVRSGMRSRSLLAFPKARSNRDRGRRRSRSRRPFPFSGGILNETTLRYVLHATLSHRPTVGLGAQTSPDICQIFGRLTPGPKNPNARNISQISGDICGGFGAKHPQISARYLGMFGPKHPQISARYLWGYTPRQAEPNIRRHPQISARYLRRYRPPFLLKRSGPGWLLRLPALSI